MNIRSIIGFLKGTSLSPIKMPLGRWNIHNYRETTLKIKYATEDNCGFSYHNSKNIVPTFENKDVDLDLDYNTYIYMMGYESVHK